MEFTQSNCWNTCRFSLLKEWLEGINLKQLQHCPGMSVTSVRVCCMACLRNPTGAGSKLDTLSLLQFSEPWAPLARHSGASSAK